MSTKTITGIAGLALAAGITAGLATAPISAQSTKEKCYVVPLAGE